MTAHKENVNSYEIRVEIAKKTSEVMLTFWL